MKYVVLFVPVILFCALIALALQQIWWKNKIKYTREYVYPIIVKFHLENIPVYSRFWGAVTYNKAAVTMCVRYGYSIDKLAFVLLHEYAHVLTLSVGHTPEFWHNFNKLLEEAQKQNIFVDDYFKTHDYCKFA